MIEKQVKEFLISKDIDMFKINEDLIASTYPENYKFIEQKESLWNYGVVVRDEKRVKKSFVVEEEALMFLIAETYLVDLRINLKKDIMKKFREEEPQKHFQFIKNISSMEMLNMDDLRILNEQELIYQNKLIINNILCKTHSIEKFYLLKLFELKSFEIVKEELLEFEIDKEVVNNYFSFEWYYSMEQEA